MNRLRLNNDSQQTFSRIMAQFDQRKKAIAIAIPSLMLLTIFYLIPNVFGYVFISKDVSKYLRNQ